MQEEIKNLLVIASVNPLACNQHVFVFFLVLFFISRQSYSPISVNRSPLVYSVLLCVGNLLCYGAELAILIVLKLRHIKVRHEMLI